MNNIKEGLPFKYHPERFDELILNEQIKPKLKEALTKKPTMLLLGPKGIGKGSFTNVFLKETELDYMWINGGSERNIDTVRDKIINFAGAMGVTDIKYIVFNEIDRLTPDAQKALLDPIEKYNRITRFIFMANSTNSLFPELLSRCQIFEFSAPPTEDIYKRCIHILKQENIKIKNKKTIIEIIKELYPDIRAILHTLDQNIINGELCDDVIIYDKYKSIDSVIDLMIEKHDKNVEKIRKILKSKYIDYIMLYDRIYHRIDEFNSPGRAMLELGEAVRYHNLVGLPEINFMTFVLKAMM